jgi:hypothetical protein
MTTQTHTPGPWRIVTDGISHWIEIHPNKIALIHAKKADLDLIAAAPDLLVVLCEMLGAAETDALDDKSNVWRSAMNDARAAIAKANGA